VTRVLVVDDNPDVLLALEVMLEATGFEPITAETGTEALRHLAMTKIDVVLTDLVMPGMDGLSLLRTIVPWPAPRPALIAMTGQTQLAYRANLEAARAIGADAVLIKPFTEPELRNSIRRLIGGRPVLVEDPQPRAGDTWARPERRRHNRGAEGSQATALVQLILGDAREAARTLGRELQLGGDAKAVGARLVLAQALALSRGIDTQVPIEQVRRWLHEAGYAV